MAAAAALRASTPAGGGDTSPAAEGRAEEELEEEALPPLLLSTLTLISPLLWSPSPFFSSGMVSLEVDLPMEQDGGGVGGEK